MLSTIEVGDFSREELLEVAPKFSEELPARIVHALPALGGEPTAPSLAPFLPPAAAVGQRAVEPIDAGVLEALLHPAMWRALRRMPPARGAQALRGAPTAVGELAEGFVTWFCDKAVRRHQGWRTDDLRVLLSAVARQTEGRPAAARRERNTDWVVPAAATPVADRPMANSLFEEAALAGLIHTEGGGYWWWRHGLVAEYLASLPAC